MSTPIAAAAKSRITTTETTMAAAPRSSRRLRRAERSEVSRHFSILIFAVRSSLIELPKKMLMGVSIWWVYLTVTTP